VGERTLLELDSGGIASSEIGDGNLAVVFQPRVSNKQVMKFSAKRS
jgi:hypothetical protein